MPRYAITERAAPFVAAHRNTGVGTVLDLTERQAEHELRLGTLVPLQMVTTLSPGQTSERLEDGDRTHLDGALSAPAQQAAAPLSVRKSKISAP